MTDTKKETVEPAITNERAVADLRQSSSISDTVEQIKSRVNSVTNNGQGISSKLLTRVKTKDVDTDERILTEAVVALQSLLPKSSAGSFFSDILNKIPFARRVKESVEKTIIDNINAEDAITKVFSSLEMSLTHMTADLEDLTELRDILDDTTIECQALENEIDAEIVKIQDDSSRRMDRITLNTLKAEIGSIKIVNIKTADNLDMQIAASEALATKMSEVKPLLHGMLSAQLVLASQVEKNQRVQQTTEIVSELMNTMIVKQNEQSHKTLMDTIKLSQTPIIQAKTLIDMKKQNEQQQLDARKLIQELNDNRIKYQKAIADTRQSLESSNLKNITMNMTELDEKPKKK